MSPPSFADINKSVKDLFNKGYGKLICLCLFFIYFVLFKHMAF